MTKQATPTKAPAETEKAAGASVMENEEVEPANTADQSKERQQLKEQQKDRIEDLDKETLLKLLHQMILIRRFEEKCAESYSLGKIGGFCHLYIGQEAVAVGALAALRPDDYVLTSYREHGQAIVKGISPDEIMAELYGKATGCSSGKGGSMHLFDADVNFLGGHAIVGGQIPLATGVAFATKYRNTDQVTLCFFGEAAVNQGAFHESLNLAQLWKLPCIYICENNQYGMGTSVARAMSLQDVSQKACAYEMAAEFVDGMDVLAVRDCVGRAVDRARREYLPTLIEVRTYRFMGHSMSDPGNYRTRAEIEKHQERDPLKLFTASLQEKGIIDDKHLEKMEKEVRETVDQSARFAEESPEPDPGELYTHVYANPLTNDQ